MATNEELFFSIFYRLDRATQESLGIRPFEIESWISDLMGRTCSRLQFTPLYKHLQNSYSLTYSSGAYSFASNTEIIIESLARNAPFSPCRITHPSVTKADDSLLPFDILPNRWDLDYPPNAPFAYAAVEGTSIYVASSYFTIDTTLQLTLRCLRTLTAAQIPAEIYDNIVDMGVEFARERQGQAMPQAEEDEQRAAI